MDAWQNGYGKRHQYRLDDTADVDELPIELRRFEESIVTVNKKHPDTFSMKSKSLGDILETQRLDLVRSRSSIPGLCSTVIHSEMRIPNNTASYESSRESTVSPQVKQ